MKEKIFLKECFLQKTNQYEALDVLFPTNKKKREKDENPLDLGSPLSLCFDKEEKMVFAISETKDYKGKKIGILSEEDAKDIKPYLEVGRTDLYECKISRFDKDGDENKRFSIAVFTVSKEHANQKQK